MFFYAAKIVWFVLQPSNVLVLSALLALVALWRGWLSLARGLLAVSVVIGLVALSPLPNILVLPLEQRFARASLEGAPIRGVIVLGGGEEASISTARGSHALNEAGERITEVVALARRLPDAGIVFSGGSAQLIPSPSSEAAVVGGMLGAMGVDGSRVVLEDRSRDTYENATFTRALVQPGRGERWLLVTSAFHMPRAMGVFRAAGFEVEPWPVDYRTRGWVEAAAFFYSAGDGLRRLDLVAKEYAGLLAYALTGRTGSLLPGP